MLVNSVKYFSSLIEPGETVSSEELVSRIFCEKPDVTAKDKTVNSLLIHPCMITKNHEGGLFIKTCEKWEL